MKRLMLLMAVSAVLFACGNAPKTKTTKEKEAKVTIVEDVFKIATANVDKEIEFTGVVKHVCRHSGRRMFVADKKEGFIKVNASEKVKKFNKELIGKTVKVKGIVRVEKISEEQIAAMEKKHAEEHADEAKEGEETGHCGTENAQIKKMRDWMKAHNKDAYEIYTVEVISVEAL